MSGPMNMEEWQRRMKAEKEAERKKKMESATILQGYRGGVKDEDMKLRALREEERKKQQAAQENLRSYKATEIQEATRAKERPVKPQQPENLPPVSASSKQTKADPMEGITAGAVSERAAALAAAATAESLPTPSSVTRTIGRKSLEGAATTESATNANNIVGSEPAAPTSDAVMTNVPAPALVEDDSPKINEFAEPVAEPTTSPALEPSPNTVEEEPTQTMPAFIPPEPAAETTTNGFATHMGAEYQQQPYRLDVLFSFGIITMQMKPVLAGYMNAVQTVAVKSLTGLEGKVTYDQSLTPYVKETVWDDSYVTQSGRNDVRRMVVTAAVPVMIANETFRNTAKNSIVEALQQTIQSGEFLYLAQGENPM